MSESTVNRVSGEQFQVVRDLLDRQEEVLEQLDALDAQVEAAIKQFVGKTDDEDTENSVMETECPAESVDGETFVSEEPAPASIETAKAA
ncbi:MAG: hypothetical protein VYE64_10605 [Planctomycetota bacterium]|nr:hypothetical protein [Planctomycetota bacterium]